MITNNMLFNKITTLPWVVTRNLLVLNIIMPLGVTNLFGSCTFKSDNLNRTQKPDICIFVEILKRGLFFDKTIILYGDTGTGKTELAQQMAKEADCKLEVINCASLVGSLSGQAAETINATLNRLRARALEAGKPIFVILDEIDAITSTITPEMQQYHEQRASATQTLGICMDNLVNTDENHELILVGTTNRPEAIDPTIISRFGLLVKVEMPTEAERKQMILQGLTKYLKQYPPEESDVQQYTKAADGLNLRDIEKVVARTAATACVGAGFMPSMLVNAFNAQKAVNKDMKDREEKNNKALSWSKYGVEMAKTVAHEAVRATVYTSIAVAIQNKFGKKEQAPGTVNNTPSAPEQSSSNCKA